MLDLVTYALLKRKLSEVSSGISNVRYENSALIFELVDGTTLETPIDFPATNLVDARLDSAANLVITFADGSELLFPSNEEKINTLNDQLQTLNESQTHLSETVQNLGLFVRDGKLYIEYEGDDNPP